MKYNPGALVVNLGEALEIISGGHFKATKHKVTATPEDQEHCERLSLVQFNASIGDMRLTPAVASPLLQREGFVPSQGIFQQYKKLMDAGVPVSTLVTTPTPLSDARGPKGAYNTTSRWEHRILDKTPKKTEDKADAFLRVGYRSRRTKSGEISKSQPTRRSHRKAGQEVSRR